MSRSKHTLDPLTEAEATEPDELTKVARDLSEIVAMHGTLEDQAVHKAGDAMMPGGDAMVMLAPVADPEAWEHIFEAREAHERPTDHVDDEDTEWEPPLQTLLFWSERWRYDHGAVTDARPTIGSEADFLRQLLNWVYENEPAWEDFSRDVRAARVRIENTLYAGERAERSRVHCVSEDCTRRPRLIKVYAMDAKSDHYKCPACKDRYDLDEFVRAKHHHLASEGAARFVKLQDAMGSLDRPERTFRKWMGDCKIAAYCDRVTHQVWVWWPDVRLADLDTPRRKKAA